MSKDHKEEPQMSKDQREGRRTDGSPRLIGRRAVLEGSAIGGAALAAGFFGPLAGTAVAGQAPGSAQPVKTGQIRRVATGKNAAGKSYIAVDEVVGINDVWSTTADQPLGLAPDEAHRADFSHATGDSRCFLAALPPSQDPKPNLTNRIGFHVTTGVAYCYVLNGEVVFLVDEEEVRLQAGDLLIERGTAHSWRNEGTEPVGLMIVVATAT